MALLPTFQAFQSADNAYIYLLDTTGVYNATSNPGGYNSPNPTPAEIAVVSIYGAFYPYPSGTAPILIGSSSNPINLTPSTAYPLPYTLWYQYILTPSLLGLPGTTFEDGIYQLNVTVIQGEKYIINNTNAFATCAWAPAGVVTDNTTGQVLGTIQNLNASGLVLYPASGNTINGAGDVLSCTTNSNLVTLTTGVLAYFYPSWPGGMIQQEITSNSDALLANALNKFIPSCGYCEDKVWCSFMELMASKSQVAASQNNSGLDSLSAFNISIYESQ